MDTTADYGKNFIDPGHYTEGGHLGPREVWANALDPVGVTSGMFNKGGLFGPPDDSSQKAQEEFLQNIRGREMRLYPKLMAALRQTEGLDKEALSTELGAIDPAYQQSMQELSTGTLPPETAAWLARLRDNQKGAIVNDAGVMMADPLQGLVNKGIMSGSTATGATNQIGKAFMPLMDQADQGYYSSMIEKPTENAMQAYDMASKYGNDMFGLLTSGRKNLVSPYLDMWSATASAGTKTAEAPQKNTAGSGLIGSLLGALTK